MRLPRDLGADGLIKELREFGYEVTRQTGSHIRLTRDSSGDVHHLTVPRHGVLRVGTLSAILREISAHLEIDKSDLIRRISR